MAARGRIVKFKSKLHRDVWPVDPAAGKLPENWAGWPNNKKFALVLTHDIESELGVSLCLNILHEERMRGFRSGFYFVPELYNTPRQLRTLITDKGCEVGVHGLNHDGKLFSSEEEFNRRALKINKYLSEWKACGFRSPAMHHNLDWLSRLNIKYDLSTFDTDPFEPQPDGTGTIFPFRVQGKDSSSSYIEMPYTLAQDFTLFIMLGERDGSIWRKKLDWIAEKGGMALLNTHPDYMNCDNSKCRREQYPAGIYFDFLNYIREEYEDQYWQPLPEEMAEFCNTLK